MYLFISSQDIKKLTIGLVQNGVLEQMQHFVSSPEQHLYFLDKQLRDWGVAIRDVVGIYVVTGPGSFTASRVSITIANTIAFARGIPVFVLTNPDRLPFDELLLQAIKKGVKPCVFAVPFYDRPPGITTPLISTSYGHF
jgi:hypothetical protein